MSAFLMSLEFFELIVLLCNLLLIVFARAIVKRFSSSAVTSNTFVFQLATLRAISMLILLVYGYYHGYLLLGGENEQHTIAIKIISMMSIIYFAYLTNDIINYWISRRYGKKRTFSGETHYIATYQTRSLTILSTAFVIIIAIVGCIKQLGYESLLEAGGIIGLIGVMIALTQGAWAPDIISGLICLNSDIFEEGDVVEIGPEIIGLVYKTKMFHTEFLNLTNNHRIMIRNSKLRDVIIHNLSKFASVKGLRECLKFNIGYDIPIDHVKSLFKEATEQAIKKEIPFEHQHEHSVKILNMGDHGITWGFIYYIKKTDQFINIRRDFREIILQTSCKHNISLATPLTHINDTHITYHGEKTEPFVGPIGHIKNS